MIVFSIYIYIPSNLPASFAFTPLLPADEDHICVYTYMYLYSHARKH
ncbi:hypothetical protein CSUI_007161, partial [Cystoisospora suis]